MEKVIPIDQPINITITKLVKKEITSATYSDEQSWSLLRFRKPDLVRLIDQLAMPPFLFSPSRHRYSKEFSIILLLRQMAYPGRLHDLEIEFGKEHTSLSRSLFKLDCKLVARQSRLSHQQQLTLLDALPGTFAAVVATKTNVPLEFANVNSILRGTQKLICRPSDGAGSVEDIQITYYSGFKMQFRDYQELADGSIGSLDRNDKQPVYFQLAYHSHSHSHIHITHFLCIATIDISSTSFRTCGHYVIAAVIT